METIYIESGIRLSLLQSNRFDSTGRELVVACGYTTTNKFCYFICWERIDAETTRPYIYEHPVAVFEKTNENTYQHCVSIFNQMLNSA